MKIRKKFLPRKFHNIAALTFLMTSIPLILWFEIYIVVPEFHSVGSYAYYCTLAAATFIALNIALNLLAVMLVDTSIKGEVLRPPDNLSFKKLWRFCSLCETMAPPRSWHCSACQTCILKRDHHCTFSGCCVGHRNHRFFLMLLMYLSIGTIYATVYNTIFFWWIHGDEINAPLTFLNMALPCSFIFYITYQLLNNSSMLYYYLILYVLNLIGLGFGLALLIYHGRIILNGSVAYESRESVKYNFGWRRNLEMALGKRWYLVWMSPFIQSELPHDGIHWEHICKETVKNI